MFYKIHIITHSRSLYYQCLTNPTEVFEQNLEGKTRSENKKYLPLWLCWEVNSKYCSLFLRSENWNPNPVSKFKVKPLFKKWNFTKKSKQGSSNFCKEITAIFFKFVQCSKNFCKIRQIWDYLILWHRRRTSVFQCCSV